jgi:hypothetical protein
LYQEWKINAILFFDFFFNFLASKNALLYERRSPTCDLVKATSVDLFGDEKITKPATACEEFDEAFWNDDTATVIRDEPSDKLSESRHSFSLVETGVAAVFSTECCRQRALAESVFSAIKCKLSARAPAVL